MASNAFSNTKPNINPPAYCYKGPFPPLPLFPPGTPPTVSAWAQWADRDPEAYTDVSVFIALPKVTEEPRYSAIGLPPGFKFMVTLEKAGPGNDWHVTLNLTGLYRPPPGETYAWRNIQIQTEPTIDTGLLTFVHLPGKDFRKCRIMQ